jgi:hypothetical protein
MQVTIRMLHPKEQPEALNQEWIVLENTGGTVFRSHGCSLEVARSRGGRGHRLGTTIDPGFLLRPGERIRMVTGTPGRKIDGPPPSEEEIKNYHLFLKAPVLADGRGTVVRLVLNQVELCHATFDPDAPSGIATEAGSDG